METKDEKEIPFIFREIPAGRYKFKSQRVSYPFAESGFFLFRDFRRKADILLQSPKFFLKLAECRLFYTAIGVCAACRTIAYR